MTKEVFKDIPGFEGHYQVSNLGRVKSLKRKKHSIMHFVENHAGYYHVTLRKDNKQYQRRIHQLVAMAFLSHTPCGMELVVDHINSIKTDNRLENLRIITPRENTEVPPGKYSKYKGVSYDKKRSKWIANIYVNGSNVHLGSFKTEKDAHNAYLEKLNKI